MKYLKQLFQLVFLLTVFGLVYLFLYSYLSKNFSTRQVVATKVTEQVKERQKGTVSLPPPVSVEKEESVTFELPEKSGPKNLSWSQLTPSAPWEARDSAVSFVFKNKMWTMGGLNGNGDVTEEHKIKYWEAPYFNDIWTSDDGVKWTRMTEQAQWSPRRSMSVVLFKDALWMFGGWGPITGYAKDVWKSTDGVSWKRVISDAPWPVREGQTAEVFQGKIWMIGGVDYDKRETKNDVWYSENGIDWYEATSSAPWSSRWDHATAVFNGKIFLTGGMNLNKQTFGDVWSSSDGINWELLTPSPSWQERQGHSLVVLGGTIWSIGRFNDNGGPNDVWYSADGDKWRKTDTDPLWLGREDHSVLVFNDRIFVFGGMDLNWHWQNDVWVSSN
jgi:Kelch motif